MPDFAKWRDRLRSLYYDDRAIEKYRILIFAALFLLLIAVLLFQAYFSLRHPQINFDFFFYVGVGHHFFGDSQVHPLTFVLDVLEKEIPWRDFSPLFTDGAYAQETLTNPDVFFQQLRYYTIKPVYPALIYLMSAAGIKFIYASVIISASSYIGIVLISWLAITYGQIQWSIAPVISALLLAFYHPLFQLASFSIPDVMNAALIVAAAYLAFCRGHWALAAAVSIACIYVRPDSLIWLFALATTYVIYSNITPRAMIKAAIVCLIGIVAYKSIHLIDEPYPLMLLQKISFGPRTAETAYPELVTDYYNFAEIAKRYLDETLNLLTGKILSSFFLFHVLLGIIGMLISRKMRSAHYLWFLPALLAMAASHLAMPKEHDRIVIYSYIMVYIGFCRIFIDLALPKRGVEAPAVKA